MDCNKLTQKFMRRRKHAKIAKDKVDETEQCSRHTVCCISFIGRGFAVFLDLLRSCLAPLEREENVFVYCFNVDCYLSSSPKHLSGII